MKTLADFLQEKGCDPNKVIVEYKGEIFAPGSDFASITYEEGAKVEIFRVVAGG